MRSSLLALLLSVLALAAPAARADSAAELRAQAQAIGSPGASADAQRAALGKLGPVAVEWIQLADKATLSGDPGSQGAELRSSYEAIRKPLIEIRNRCQEATDGQVQKIIEADGDLEALYETAPYKDAQQIGANALYFLNWVDYYGSRLYDGERRKQLLQQAQDGFSQLAGGDDDSELTVESLLGRGLCQLEGGDLGGAIDDLKVVADNAKASPERRDKARLALLDAYVKKANHEAALKLSADLLTTAKGAEADYVRFLRLRTLLAAAKKKQGPVDQYRQEAMVLAERLRAVGGAWEARVAALIQTEVDNPEEWAKKSNSPFAKWELARMLVGKGDLTNAKPLLEEVVGSTDKSLDESKGEASYFLGLAQFKAGQFAEAAASLDRALAEPKADYGSEAAYLRFKAMEALAASHPEATDPKAYEKALRGFVEAYPDHKSAFEGHYRLGELLQAQQQYATAIEELGRVKGDPGFEVQAQFASLQCRFELLQHATTEKRSALLTDIGAALDAFAPALKSMDKKVAAQLPVAQMRAKTAVMRAVYLELQPRIDDAAIIAALAGVEADAKDQPDLAGQAVKLRLRALERRGDYAEARRELQRNGSALAAQADRATIESLAIAFIRGGARDKTKNDDAQQVALGLYELLPDEGAGASKTKLTLARLYENTGDLKKAAELYQQVVTEKGASLSAMRGLARIAEAEQHLDEALSIWLKLSEKVRAGDLPWYEAGYETARLRKAKGDKAGSCKGLTDLRPAMPGLADQDLRQKLSQLYDEVCG